MQSQQNIKFVWNIFHSKKNWVRYEQKCVFVFKLNTRYSSQIIKKPGIFLADFVKILK
jgi:hypothetical protein